MNEAGEAFEAIVGLLVGGLIFLAFSGTLGSTGLVDFGLWGVIYIVVAIVLAIAAVVAFISQFL